ncbi:MAG: RidA family protein [Gemmatimonadaceae bacterium]|nr:RidA family protein [Gemmatimonadaceae bacterium]
MSHRRNRCVAGVVVALVAMWSGARLEAQVIRRTNPPTLSPTTGYSHVVEATGGRTIWISGQVALDSTGALVGAGDVQKQVEQVYENLRRALAAAGATFADVVKMNTYMLDAANVGVLREVRAKYLRPDQLPASTFVAVSGLARPEWLVEIEVIAVVR